jgi:hypothetical protein
LSFRNKRRYVVCLSPRKLQTPQLVSPRFPESSMECAN